MPMLHLDPLCGFPWKETSERAAMLIAEGSRTFVSIAEEVGVHKDTIRMWMKHPEFKERIQENVAAMQHAMVETGILHKQERVADLQDIYQRIRQVIDERAVDPALQHIPGGRTGLMVHRVKMIGTGRTAMQIDEYEVDHGLLGELRAVLKHTAQELGQWSEKTENDHAITRIEVRYEDRLPQDL